MDPEKSALASKDQLFAMSGLAPWLRTRASGVRLPHLLAAKLEKVVVTKTGSGDASVARQLQAKERILEAAEGKLLLRKHFARERDRRLVESKRQEMIEKCGKRFCEICDLDFVAPYGELGSGVIECHHTKPIASLPRGYKTHIDDLALLCANCHRVLHKGNYTVSSLRALVNGQSS